MKKNNFLKLFFIFLATHFYAQQHRITFEYDIAGNQIKRNVCFGCSARLAKNNDTEKDTEKETKKSEKETVTKPVVESNDYIKYFPNPVIDELNISWEMLKTSEIIELKIFNSTGVLVFSKDLKKETTTLVSFQSYPQGIYFVELLHNNGHINTIKIIKKQ
jgi:hypothetical protein